jgi:hypothetical protein
MKSKVVSLEEMNLEDEFQKIRSWKAHEMQREDKNGRNIASRLYHAIF